MSTTVKRAISLPKEQDAQLKRLSRSSRAPYSRLVQAAIHAFLEAAEQADLLRSYETYYSNSGTVLRTKQLVDDFQSLSRKALP